MKTRFNTTVQLLRHFGPGWLMFRLGYALRRRAGVLRRTLPPTSWEDQPLDSFLGDRVVEDQLVDFAARPPFLFTVDEVVSARPSLARWDAESSGPLDSADAIGQGVFRFFEHLDINLGCPPDWHHNPVTGDQFPPDRHWTEIGDFAAGDIKLVWEPSRFAWVYPLVRAYLRSGDERYPKLFWTLFEDWRQANPPQLGVNWKCGQEVAIRLMACSVARYGFSRAKSTTPDRIAALAQLMAVSARRIEANLAYALSQQNNHGITESVGLWTVGLLFPELKSAAEWRRIGQAAIEQQVQTLIDEDGAFSQHSVNYQRVMLDACVWAVQLGRRNGVEFSDRARDRIRRAGEFLWQLQDSRTGQLPRHGQNDGALLLPLTNCPPEDYRPIIQAVAMLDGERRYESGPWDEVLVWLFGGAAAARPVRRPGRGDWQAPAGGYQVLRSRSGHLLTRTPRYRHRPAHADALHVDLWWRGINTAIDAGTFSYNAPPPWNNPLAGTSVHNTVTVDGRDQMDRAGRFLWLPWVSGRRTASVTSSAGLMTYWEGTHNGYERLNVPARHRRGVLRIGDEHWLIVDALHSRGPHRWRLHWLLADFPFVADEGQGVLTLETPAGDYQVTVGCTQSDGDLSLVRADEESARGWYAPNYAARRPALSLALEVTSQRATFATLLGPGETELQVFDRSIAVRAGSGFCYVDLAPVEEREHLVLGAELKGRRTDRLTTGGNCHPS